MPKKRFAIPAVKLAAKYSFMPNKLKYVEQGDADQIILDYCCGHRKNYKMARELIESMESVNIFLRLIAEKNNLNQLSKKVVEAYWIGNELLDNINGSDIKKALKKELKPEVARLLSKKVPGNALPHHSFHVFHINAVTGAPIFFSNIDNCRIHPAIVSDVSKSTLIVSYKPLVKFSKIEQKQDVEKKINYNPKLSGNLAVGDIIAVHWNLAIDKLTPKQSQDLEKYTLKNIDAMNSLN